MWAPAPPTGGRVAPGEAFAPAVWWVVAAAACAPPPAAAVVRVVVPCAAAARTLTPPTEPVEFEPPTWSLRHTWRSGLVVGAPLATMLTGVVQQLKMCAGTVAAEADGAAPMTAAASDPIATGASRRRRRSGTAGPLSSEQVILLK